MFKLVSWNTYLKKTKYLRGSSKLFLSYVEPHRVISKDTLDSSYKSLLAESGINVAKYFTTPADQLHNWRPERVESHLKRFLKRFRITLRRQNGIVQHFITKNWKRDIHTRKRRVTLEIHTLEIQNNKNNWYIITLNYWHIVQFRVVCI